MKIKTRVLSFNPLKLKKNIKMLKFSFINHAASKSSGFSFSFVRVSALP